jgi:hypothetical protein
MLPVITYGRLDRRQALRRILWHEDGVNTKAVKVLCVGVLLPCLCSLQLHKEPDNGWTWHTNHVAPNFEVQTQFYVEYVEN